jgi:hypothetical protein
MRQSPWQAVGTEDDWELDNNLLMAKYLELEVACEHGSFVKSRFVFMEQGDTPDNLKVQVQRHLIDNAIDTPHFKAIYLLTGRVTHQDDTNTKAKVGAHSNRKYGKTKDRGRLARALEGYGSCQCSLGRCGSPLP